MLEALPITQLQSSNMLALQYFKVMLPQRLLIPNKCKIDNLIISLVADSRGAQRV